MTPGLLAKALLEKGVMKRRATGEREGEKPIAPTSGNRKFRHQSTSFDPGFAQGVTAAGLFKAIAMEKARYIKRTPKPGGGYAYTYRHETEREGKLAEGKVKGGKYSLHTRPSGKPVYGRKEIHEHIATGGGEHNIGKVQEHKSEESHELELYAGNDQPSYKRTQAFKENMAKKIVNGQEFDATRANHFLRSLIDQQAKNYEAEFGSRSMSGLSSEDKDVLAHRIMHETLGEIKDGEWAHLKTQKTKKQETLAGKQEAKDPRHKVASLAKALLRKSYEGVVTGEYYGRVGDIEKKKPVKNSLLGKDMDSSISGNGNDMAMLATMLNGGQPWRSGILY